MDIFRLAITKKLFKDESGVVSKLQSKTITENGEHRPDAGYDGFSKVTVNVEGSTLEKFDGAVVTDCLTFSSPNSFTLKAGITPDTPDRESWDKYTWEGTLEYSTDSSVWHIWDGSRIMADNGKLYLRGTGNTRISCNVAWSIEGTDVSCTGNIENLLDYTTVAKGEHPTMASQCFGAMFHSCSALISAPELPAPTATYGCYTSMFKDCINLENAPALPATTVEGECYWMMFQGCTKLKSIPALPALSLPNVCYAMMFEDCPNIQLSTEKTDEYQYEYRIPISGEGVIPQYSSPVSGMFGTTPSINTTYYTANEVIYADSDEPHIVSPTTITYDGATITNLDIGQMAIIHTAKTEVEHDIVIHAGQQIIPMPESYKGTVTVARTTSKANATSEGD